MKTLLSTKILSPAQKKIIPETGFTFREYDAITVDFIPFSSPATIKNAIFTSKNAVKAVFEKHPETIAIEHIFCVGEKTKAFLLKKGQKVTKSAKYASKLADFIQKIPKNDAFYFFCGDRRREELPSVLKNKKIPLFEVKTYKISLNLIKFTQKFDGILFFSPSGVASFTSQNELRNSIAYCIGDTTASEAKKYTEKVVLAEETSIESVIKEATRK